MRYTLSILCGLLITSSLYADNCPTLKEIKPYLGKILTELRSEQPGTIKFDGKVYNIKRGFGSSSTVDMIAGNYRGYYFYRLYQDNPGVCDYIVMDDRTKAVGHFILENQVVTKKKHKKKHKNNAALKSGDQAVQTPSAPEPDFIMPEEE